jgi:Na+-translocating ferredoxin:NAD+ oxidoreductase RNF subunit RnfB
VSSAVGVLLGLLLAVGVGAELLALIASESRPCVAARSGVLSACTCGRCGFGGGLPGDTVPLSPPLRSGV